MEIVDALLNGGAFGIVAAASFYLYISEKGAHKDTLNKLEQALKDRITDSKEYKDSITEPLRGISVGIQNLGDKIEISKRS